MTCTRRVLLTVLSCITIALVGSAKSETKIWDGGDGFWDESRWNGGGSPPVLDGTDDAVIGSGFVIYDSFGTQDFVIDPDSDLTVTSGGTWANSNPEWTEINGSLNLDGGSFERTGGGVLYLGGGGGAIANETATISVSNGGTLQNEGEVWFGAWEQTPDNLTTIVTVEGGTLDWGPLDPNENVSVFFTDPTNDPAWVATGGTSPSYSINFTGTTGTMIVGADGIAMPTYNTDDDPTNPGNPIGWEWDSLSYEDLWDLGILQAAGESGQTGANFNNHFTVTGTLDQPNYTLTVGGLVDGDFNGDGNWDCTDINALTSAIAGGSTDLSFDMNGDGAITLADVTDAGSGWLAIGGANNVGVTGGNPFLSGDANLSGAVDVSDFNVWNANKFTAVDAWCSGDFNADGSGDVSDFNVWNGNKFSSSIVAVPEPSTATLLTACMATLAVICRRRRSFA